MSATPLSALLNLPPGVRADRFPYAVHFRHVGDTVVWCLPYMAAKIPEPS